MGDGDGVAKDDVGELHLVTEDDESEDEVMAWDKVVGT